MAYSGWNENRSYHLKFYSAQRTIHEIDAVGRIGSGDHGLAGTVGSRGIRADILSRTGEHPDLRDAAATVQISGIQIPAIRFVSDALQDASFLR